MIIKNVWLPGDRVFEDGSSVHRDKLQLCCSRCGTRIQLEEAAVRCYDGEGAEYRYHPRCLGLDDAYYKNR